jgi:hypothetical protein
MACLKSALSTGVRSSMAPVTKPVPGGLEGSNPVPAVAGIGISRRCSGMLRAAAGIRSAATLFAHHARTGALQREPLRRRGP